MGRRGAVHRLRRRLPEDPPQRRDQGRQPALGRLLDQAAPRPPGGQGPRDLQHPQLPPREHPAVLRRLRHRPGRGPHGLRRRERARHRRPGVLPGLRPHDGAHLLQQGHVVRRGADGGGHPQDLGGVPRGGQEADHRRGRLAEPGRLQLQHLRLRPPARQALPVGRQPVRQGGQEGPARHRRRQGRPRLPHRPVRRRQGRLARLRQRLRRGLRPGAVRHDLQLGPLLRHPEGQVPLHRLRHLPDAGRRRGRRALRLRPLQRRVHPGHQQERPGRSPGGRPGLPEVLPHQRRAAQEPVPALQPVPRVGLPGGQRRDRRPPRHEGAGLDRPLHLAGPHARHRGGQREDRRRRRPVQRRRGAHGALRGAVRDRRRPGQDLLRVGGGRLRPRRRGQVERASRAEAA